MKLLCQVQGRRWRPRTLGPRDGRSGLRACDAGKVAVLQRMGGGIHFTAPAAASAQIVGLAPRPSGWRNREAARAGARPAWCGGPGALGLRVDHELAVGHGGRCDGELHQAEEEHASRARVAAVEAEGELVEVRIEVLGANHALVGAKQPALEQARDAVNARHHDVRRIVLLAQHRMC